MLKLKIVTPNGATYQSEEISSITLPTTEGVLTILEDHAALVALLEPGEIEIQKDKNTIRLAVSAGIIHVADGNEIHIMADTAERAEDIDLERAEEARKRAEEYLAQQQDMADEDFARLEAKIQKEMARLSVGRRYRSTVSKMADQKNSG